MADTTIEFTIPEAKVSRVIDAMKGLHPIPNDENGDPEFTDNQWAKEAVRRWVVSSVKRWEVYEAKNAIDISADNELIS